MNYTLFPDRLVNRPPNVGLVSAKTDWVIKQSDQTGIIEIRLFNRDCHEAYRQAKAFGINVDRKWWQFWISWPNVRSDDNRS